MTLQRSVPKLGQMTKTFEAAATLDELNRVNDEQKAIFAARVAADPNLIEERQAAYLRRWSEALPHIRSGQSVLDIGAGWPVPRVADAVFGHGSRYHVVDIDKDQIDAWAQELERRGQDGRNAKHSPNTVLPFADGSMDFIFSSHCIEHSPDLRATLSEMKRVLRPGGQAYLSVPFGFDDSDEHLLFLGVEEWLRVLEVAGFKVRSWTIGNTFTEGWDLSILAASVGSFDGDEVENLDKAFQKPGRRLLAHDDPGFSYEDANPQGPFTICRGFTLSSAADYLLFLRHEWSGIIELRDAQNTIKRVDLYDRADHIEAVQVRGLQAPIDGRIVGRNASSRDDQAVVYGALR